MPPGAAILARPPLDAPKTYRPRAITSGARHRHLDLVVGDRDPLILNGEGIEVQAVRICTDHNTPLDADQRCGHGHVSEWWCVEVNGKVQYDGRKFSSVEDEVPEEPVSLSASWSWQR